MTTEKTPEQLKAERKAALFNSGLERTRSRQVELIATLQAERDMHQNAAAGLNQKLEDAKLLLEELNSRLPPVTPV